MSAPAQALRLLVIGAHPDDAEFHAGGLLTRFCAAGHRVHVISVTDGAAGHHALPADALAKARAEEAARAGARCGFSTEVWQHPDGALEPTLAVRMQVIRAIRAFAPDVLLTHRVNDYHPDHRAVGQLVQDASFMVRVPKVAPEVPALRADPVVLFMADFFTRPNAFRGDVVVDVGPEMPAIIDLLDCHATQVYEWLPWLDGRDDVPTTPEARRAWLHAWFAHRPRAVAERHREALVHAYGDRAEDIEFAEALEESEYGRRLTPRLRQQLFGWLYARG